MSSIDYPNNSSIYNSEKYAPIPIATPHIDEKLPTPKGKGQIKIQEDFAMDEEQDEEDDEEVFFEYMFIEYIHLIPCFSIGPCCDFRRRKRRIR